MSLLQHLFTKSFLQNIFHQYFKENVDVTNVVVKDLLGPGSNYCSKIKHILFTYKANGIEEKAMSIVAKCFPEGESEAEFVTEMGYFDCELKIYHSVVPKLAGLDYSEEITPKLYLCCNQPTQVILLEDLQKLNFRLTPRGSGLDLQHSLLVMEKLAYLHAASVLLHEQDLRLFSTFNKTLFRKSVSLDQIMRTCYKGVVQICQRVPELHQYVDKIAKAEDKVFETMYTVPGVNSKFKVLNHGDCWANNILFCYNDNHPVDLRFIDFQNSCFTSPWLDLSYFMSTSLDYNIRNQENVIIDHYFMHLVRMLNKLHVKTVPNREEFNKDFNSMSYIGFGGSILTLMLFKITKTEFATTENFLTDDSENGFRFHCFHNKEYVKEVMRFVPYYDKLGIFNV